MEVLQFAEDVLSSMPETAPSPMFWGSSPALAAIRRMVQKIAPTDASVLITGENGTGKDVLAREIHSASLRSGRPLVAVDAGAIPESLFESELFGHVKGAFTDAHTDSPGKFEQADGGTLFLDEIGNIPLHLQAKLLRALQSRSIDPQTNTYFTQTSFHNNYGISAGYELFDGFRAVNNLKISITGRSGYLPRSHGGILQRCVLQAPGRHLRRTGGPGRNSPPKARCEEELGLKSHADVVQTEAKLADEPTGKLDSKNGREVMVTYSQQSISRSGMVLRRNTGSCPALRWER